MKMTAFIPYQRGLHRQRVRCFGAIPRVTKTKVTPFCPEGVVAAAKKLCVDLLAFDVQQIAVVVNGRRKVSKSSKSLREQALWKNWILNHSIKIYWKNQCVA